MNYKIEPWAHQKAAIEDAASKRHYALFFEPGTGKTMTAINIVRAKSIKAKRLLKTLVFCPNVVCNNWKEEVLKNSMLYDKQVLVSTDSCKKRAKQVQEGNFVFFITPYSSLLSEDFLAAVEAHDFSCLVFDESHYLKNFQSKRHKAAFKLSTLPSFKHKYLLTGTPVLKTDLTELQPQMKILEPSVLGGNFYQFRAIYMKPTSIAFVSNGRAVYDWEPQPGAHDRIYEKIKPYCMSVKRDEVLDLPDLIQQTIKVPLSNEQKFLYNSMENDCIAELESGEYATASIAMTKILRLQQITTGFVKNELEEEFELGTNPKLKALEELLETLRGHKVLVWAVFKNNFKQIQKMLDKNKIGYVVCNGDTKNKDEAMKTFKEDKDCMVYLGHPGAGGIGVNLVEAKYSIWFSRNFSLEQDLQASARNYRSGSEIHNKITRYDLVSEDSVDGEIVTSLLEKKDFSDSVLENLKINMKVRQKSGSCK